jgi:hypothetical protein
MVRRAVIDRNRLLPGQPVSDEVDYFRGVRDTPRIGAVEKSQSASSWFAKWQMSAAAMICM